MTRTVSRSGNRVGGTKKFLKRLTNGSGSDLECMDLKEALLLFFHTGDKFLLVAQILLWLKDPLRNGGQSGWWKSQRGVDPEEGLGRLYF